MKTLKRINLNPDQLRSPKASSDNEKPKGHGRNAASDYTGAEQVADRIYPVFEQLKRQAAQGDVLYNDDTTVKILSLMKENEKAERKGMFTTGILSTTNDRFADVTWNFPHQCRYVLETLAKVYRNDRIAKEKHMNPEKRLSFHQRKSKPLTLFLRMPNALLDNNI